MSHVDRSQNGWPVIHDADSPLLHTWVIPSRSGEFTLRLVVGPLGFLLAVLALWVSEVIEICKGKVLDDWGWAPPRPIRGQTSGFSNHCSGTAMDLNATKHPLAVVGTFNTKQLRLIHRYLRFLGGAIRGGIDYSNRQDAMHWEGVQDAAYCARQARRVARFPRGRRVLKANPSQRRGITGKAA